MTVISVFLLHESREMGCHSDHPAVSSGTERFSTLRMTSEFHLADKPHRRLSPGK